MRWALAIFLFLSSPLASLANYSIREYPHLIGMPGFSDSLIQMHLKLYEGYVKNTNDLLAKLQSVDPNSYEYGALKRRLGWEFDGMKLHELYFENLGGKNSLDKKSDFYKAIVSQFGSFEKWKREFIGTGTIRGIGWALLYFDVQEGRLLNVWINEHDGGHLVKGVPLLIMDVFEHAFMPQFGLDKLKYIEAFFNNIDWNVVSERYKKAVSVEAGS